MEPARSITPTTLKPTEPTISPLSDRDEINAAWKRHRQHILNALDHSDHAFSEADILLSVLSGKLTLWSGEHSILLTEVRDYPNFRGLGFVIAGGDLGELRDMERQIIELARAHGCTKAAIVNGRRGWGRALDGYCEVSVNLVKDI